MPSDNPFLDALRQFRSDWESFQRLPITENTAARGDALAVEQNLRGYDATHLACALIWQETLGAHEGYRDMEAFIATVRNRRLHERLERSISERSAFWYFKDVLLDYPAERERWFQFKQEREHQRILDWLEAYGIAPLQ